MKKLQTLTGAKLKSIVIILLTFFVFESAAQSFYHQNHDRRWLFTAGTGITSYFGELANPGDYLDAKPNLNFGLERKLNTKWGVRTELTWYQIAGSDAEASDASRRERNLSFKSNNFEINIEALWMFFREGVRFYQRRVVNPYLLGGIGLTHFTPKTDYEGITYNLRKYKTEDIDYGSTALVLPVGFGFRLRLSHILNLNFEGGYRITFTDHLDDVSTSYIATEGIEDPVRVALIDRRPELGLQPAEPGTQRGNPEQNDGYAIFNIKVEYYLPSHLIFPPKDKQQGSGKKKHRKMIE